MPRPGTFSEIVNIFILFCSFASKYTNGLLPLAIYWIHISHLVFIFVHCMEIKYMDRRFKKRKTEIEIDSFVSKRSSFFNFYLIFQLSVRDMCCIVYDWRLNSTYIVCVNIFMFENPKPQKSVRVSINVLLIIIGINSLNFPNSEIERCDQFRWGSFFHLFCYMQNFIVNKPTKKETVKRMRRKRIKKASQNVWISIYRFW